MEGYGEHSAFTKKKGIVQVQIKDKKVSLKNWPHREIFDFKVEGVEQTKSSYFTFTIIFSSPVNLDSVDVKYGTNLLDRSDIYMKMFQTATLQTAIRLGFSWDRLLDQNFHIFDVFTVLMTSKEASCEFSFKVAEKNRTKFKKDLSQYDITEETVATLKNLYNNNFEIEGKSYEFEDKLVFQEIENYYKMNIDQRISSKQLYDMLRYALQIEDLEFRREYESLVMNDVQLQKTGNDCYNFRYSLELFMGCNESFKDFSLEIMSMTDYAQNKNDSSIHAILNYNLDVIIFRTGRSFDLNKRYHIKIIPSNFTFRVCFNALGLLRLFNMEEFFNNFEDPLRSKRSKRVKSWIETKYFNQHIKSNPEQMMAIKSIVEKTAFPFPFVVFGPPGTGKTTVIIESVAQILDRDKNARILITAQSNYACDEIAVRLMKYVSRSKIYRHYSKRFECRKDEIPPELVEISNMNENFSDDMISVEQFYHFNVIIVTLMSAIRFIELKVKRYFDYIFVDEAAAATEPEILIPITGYGMTFHEVKSCIVLFGDHKQLGPIVKSEYSEKLGLDVSLMERIVTTKYYKEDSSSLKVQLLDNYRSHPKILEFPNTLFYDNKLRSQISKEDAEFAIGWNSLPNKEIPILLHPVFDSCSQEGTSFCNQDEINIVRMYVDFLLKFGINGKKVSQNDIGIVTPYRAQLLKLGREFSDVSGVEIGTAEHYQGREKKIIIISTVKSGRDFTVGFLANEKRLNVILTRAKCLLIVVCNPINLQRDPQWRDFIEFCVKNEVCFGDKIRLREKFERSKVDKKENSFFIARKKRVDKSQDVIEVVDPDDCKDVEMMSDSDTKSTSSTVAVKNVTRNSRILRSKEAFKDNTTTVNEILSSIRKKYSDLSVATPASRRSQTSLDTSSQKSQESNGKSALFRQLNAKGEFDPYSNKLRSEEGFKTDALKDRLRNANTFNSSVDLKSSLKEVEKIQHESYERRQAEDRKFDSLRNTRSSSIANRLKINSEDNTPLKRLDDYLEGRAAGNQKEANKKLALRSDSNQKWQHDCFESLSQSYNDHVKRNKQDEKLGFEVKVCRTNGNLSSKRNQINDRQAAVETKKHLQKLNLHKTSGCLSELIGHRLTGLKLRAIEVPLQTMIYNASKRNIEAKKLGTDALKMDFDNLKDPLQEKPIDTAKCTDPFDEWNNVLKTPVAGNKITLLDSPNADLMRPVLEPICLYMSPSICNEENLINEAKVQNLLQNGEDSDDSSSDSTSSETDEEIKKKFFAEKQKYFRQFVNDIIVNDEIFDSSSSENGGSQDNDNKDNGTISLSNSADQTKQKEIKEEVKAEAVQNENVDPNTSQSKINDNTQTSDLLESFRNEMDMNEEEVAQYLNYSENDSYFELTEEEYLNLIKHQPELQKHSKAYLEALMNDSDVSEDSVGSIPSNPEKPLDLQNGNIEIDETDLSSEEAELEAKVIEKNESFNSCVMDLDCSLVDLPESESDTDDDYEDAVGDIDDLINGLGTIKLSI